MRLAFAFLAALTVTAIGTILFEEFGIGGLAWHGLVIVAVITATLVDHHSFYGPDDSPRPR